MIMLRFLFLFNVMYIAPVVLGIVACEEKYGPLINNPWIIIPLGILTVNVIGYFLLRNEINK